MRAPSEGWSRHPNLRLKPRAPAANRGRLQTAVRRAFVAHGDVVTSSQVYDWTYARQRRIKQRHRYSVWRILDEIGIRVGRGSTHGRPWIWRLKSPLK
jgi:hypothetical protein